MQARPLRLRFAFCCLVAAALPVGCLGFPYHAHVEDLPVEAQRAGMRRLEVNAGRYIGISDLTAATDANGQTQLFIVPERQRTLLQVDLPRGTSFGRAQELLGTQIVARNIEGVPPYADTESLAVLSPDTFALGTETPWADRDHDDILLVASEEHPAKVRGVLRFAYAPYGLRGQSNAGIEGLCFAGNTLLAASETSGLLADGHRFAPLGRKGDQDPTFVPMRLQLTSATGRISALSCRVLPQTQAASEAVVLEVMAIERNYGTCRVLAFAVASNDPPGKVVVPRVALDLVPLLQPLRNYEGISWLPDGNVLLMTDNSMGFATGPTEALLVPQAMLQPPASKEPACPAK